MNTKILALVLVAAILCSGMASAKSAIYVAKTSLTADGFYPTYLQSMGFTVTTAYEGSLPGNITSYDLLVVNNDNFANPSTIPVNTMPTLIVNTANIDDFHWSSASGTTSTSGFVQGRLATTTHAITQNVTFQFNLYTAMNQQHYYLPKGFKSQYLTNIFGKPTDVSDSIISVADVGTRLRDNQYSQAKGVFFGINKHDIWSADSEKLFRNSIIWLTTDMAAPNISNITVSSITNQSAIISWNTNKAANSTLSYGTTPAMGTIISNAAFSTSRAASVNNLQEERTYYYQVTACNKDSYCTTSLIKNFTTLDLSAPVLLSVASSTPSNLSAVVSITTNEAANATVFYGTDAGNLSNTASNSSYSTEKAIAIMGLPTEGLYYYKVQVCDDSANCRDSSIQTFHTLDDSAPSAPDNFRAAVIQPDNQINLTWDAAAGATQYRIYTGDSPSTISYATPYATTASTSYIDTAAAESAERYYVVRAEDAAHNSENNTNTIGKYDVTVGEASTFVSIGIMPFDSSLNAALHQSASHHPIYLIQTLNAGTYTFTSASYDADLNIWNSSIASIEPLTGYVFTAYAPSTVTFVGTPLTSTTIHLASGPNLVGLRLHGSGSIASTIVQTPEDRSVSQISERQTDGSYASATYYGTNGWYNPNDITLDAGTAYWVHATQDTTLEVDQ